jgi:GNAT superfamily N-acetyltransferase
MFPTEGSRAPGLSKLMGFFAGGGVRHPSTRMTDRAEAVAIWVPPGIPEMTPEAEAAFGPILEEALGARADEVHALFDLLEDHHPDDEPHYYLSLWATRRDHAGRGIGTALIRENLARIDAERMPAYLESSNPANLPRYEVLGLRRRDNLSPPDGPVITTMWRDAR